MHGGIEVDQITTHPHVHLHLDAPMQDCGAMLRSVPPSMTPTIGRIEAHGAIGWHVGLHTQLPNIGATSVDLALGDTPCVVDRLGDIDLEQFKRRTWSRPVNENGNILEDVPIGPGSGSWVALAEMPAHLPYAMWATEDSFYRHRGISESLLAKALAIDLNSGRFTYGGSTITQQLVKNLFLRRTKALSRKFEEMLIAWQMEKVLGKQRIIEIYINGVEFGPKIYGIRRAAWAYFQKTPQQLSPKESVFLAIIKPSPPMGWWAMRTQGWNAWFERKSTYYMNDLLEEALISAEEYEAEKPWQPVFNPPPRDTVGPSRPARPAPSPAGHLQR
jgi:membrane peptidoglycan carboxypeptidase